MHHSLEEYRAARPDGEGEVESTGLMAWGTRSVLRRYGAMMTPSYLRRTYPGMSTEQLAVQRIRYGAIWASLIGAMTGLAMTAGDLGVTVSFGLTLLVTLAAVFADALLFIRQQIRTVFDLSVIYGTPLDPSDSEDCTVLYLTALGASAAGAVGTGVVPIAHRIVEAKGKNLLRSGARAALRGLATRLGGVQFAKKLGERAFLRATLPILSILVGAIVNFVFSKVFSARARSFLKERAIVVRPLLHLYSVEPKFSRVTVMRLINTVINEVRGSDWTEEQERAVRHAELFLRFRPEDHDAMTRWVERGMPESDGHHVYASPEGRDALRDVLETMTALDESGSNARDYRDAIKTALGRLDEPEFFDAPEAIEALEPARAQADESDDAANALEPAVNSEEVNSEKVNSEEVNSEEIEAKVVEVEETVEAG